MTEEQKEILIAKMLDVPSSLSDEELAAVVEDEELREIYEISSAVSGACIRQPKINVEEEWKCFRPYIKPKPAPMRWIMKVAAIFLGIVSVSAIVIKIIDSAFTTDTQSGIVKVEQPVAPKQSVTPEQVVTLKETTQELLAASETTTVASVKKKQLNKRKRKVSKAAEVEIVEPEKVIQSDEVDIDEFLRIQQARIDNDLALQTARVIEDEYYNVCLLCDEVGWNDELMNNKIRKLTIQ
ncbi:MAG: hypothetical protein K2H47_07970 [Muribaculaceae bacterium]|nr:hypothetical protein [Muribaculaceae bacterium]